MTSTKTFEKFQKHFLNLSYSDAKKLSAIKYSCLEEIEHRMTVPLAPKYLSGVRRGLKEHLNNKILFLYVDELNGVPLAYNQIKIVSSSIIDDQEFIVLDIKVNFVIFKVNISNILCGTVTKISKYLNICFKPKPLSYFYRNFYYFQVIFLAYAELIVREK